MKRNMVRFTFKNNGFSLIEIIVATGLLAALSIGFMRMFSGAIKTNSGIESKLDLVFLKGNVYSQLDCSQTLDASTTNATKTCNKNTILRRKNGTPIGDKNNMIGKWKLVPNCDTDELIIGYERDGNNPRTKRPWNDSSEAKDIFAGVSDFCRDYLDAGYSFWEDLPLQSDWKNATGFSTPKLSVGKLADSMVILRGTLISGQCPATFSPGAANWKVITKLPSQYRPSSNLVFRLPLSHTGLSVRVDIIEDGSVRLPHPCPTKYLDANGDMKTLTQAQRQIYFDGIIFRTR